MTDAVAIHPDGRVEELTRPAGEDWLRFLHNTVVTDVVDLVPLPQGCALVLDQEGDMKNRHENPVVRQVLQLMTGRRVIPLLGVGVFVGGRSDFRPLSESELRAVREAIADVAGGPH